jgi:hypothetical protein
MAVFGSVTSAETLAISATAESMLGISPARGATTFRSLDSVPPYSCANFAPDSLETLAKTLTFSNGAYHEPIAPDKRSIRSSDLVLSGGSMKTVEFARKHKGLACTFTPVSGTQRTGSKVSCKKTGCRFSMSLVPGLAKSQALLNLSSRGLIVFFPFEQSSVEHPETFSLEG